MNPDNNLKIIKNFVNEEDFKELNFWTLNNYKSASFTDANMGAPSTRLTTRYAGKNTNFSYPKVAYNIKNKIIECLNISKKYLSPPIGKDSIINGIGFDGGDIFEHTDPIWFPNTYTIHCNIITQKSIKGGITIIENREYDINEGDLLIYNVSHLKHKVTLIEGTLPRIFWVFGFSVNFNNLTKIFNKNKNTFDYS